MAAPAATIDPATRPHDGAPALGPDVEAAAPDRAACAELAAAIAHSHLFLAYQPLIRLDTGEVVAAEALVRWRHERDGVRAPATFISLAERCGLIHDLGTWVLRQACRQRCAWTADGVPSFPVHINVSALEIARHEFAADVLAVLDETGLPPAALTLELTETTLVEATPTNRRTFDALGDAGVTFCLDDFAMGHASLKVLRDHRFATLKLPREFVADLPHDAADVAIVEAVIGLAHKLGLSVVAEGVASLEQALFLRQRGCDMAQGFLFSPPVDPEDLVAHIERDRTTRPIPVHRRYRRRLHPV